MSTCGPLRFSSVQYMVSVPFHTLKLWAFLGMFAQVPLAIGTRILTKGSSVGNVMFWLSIMLGERAYQFLGHSASYNHYTELNSVLGVFFSWGGTLLQANRYAFCYIPWTMHPGTLQLQRSELLCEIWCTLSNSFLLIFFLTLRQGILHVVFSCTEPRLSVPTCP